MSDSIFTKLREERTLFETENFFVIEDGYPVSPGHLLVISKVPKPDFFALSDAERLELHGPLPRRCDDPVERP